MVIQYKLITNNSMFLSTDLLCQMLEYLKSKEDFVDLIVKHLGTSAVMDLLLRLITSVESPQLRQDLLEVRQ